MIIRSAIACEVCSQPHTTRIGLGQEASQTHRFPCRGCGEEIVLRLDADARTATVDIFCVENAKKISGVPGAPIVNLDANFVIPASEQGKDLSFSRLQQVMKMVEAAEARGSLKTATLEGLTANRLSRPNRPPDYADEWKILRRAWTLHRNEKFSLSKKKIEEASTEFYSKDPLDHLQDWLWRFTMFMSAPAYQPKFMALMDAIKVIADTPRLGNFLKAYPAQIAPYRGKKYLDIFEDFFVHYPEFAQVFFLVTQEVPLDQDHEVTSTGFKQTKMFYGDTFERFAALAELLALLNNMVAGREWDKFEKLTLADYRKLDRANAFNAFAATPAFAAICEEADNQIRNASHHGSMRSNSKDGMINFRTGKGAQGPEQSLSYTNYLERCVRIFLQTATLFRFELMLCHQTKLPFPL